MIHSFVNRVIVVPASALSTRVGGNGNVRLEIHKLARISAK